MGLTRAQRSFLENRFESRVNFDPVERRLYGHDIGALPHLVRPLVGRTTPDAVVQPESEEELVELARWAFHQGVPMTPRARASSGYGGAVPVKGGLVVDFYRMADVEAVDRDGLTVTVQPGITWEKLDRALAAEGLTLRLYPSSYPSSTVGGWLAQGGAGFGSYEFGFFRDNVVSAHVVLPGGETRVFEGDDLELVSEAEGTTGFISSVTLKVMPVSELGLAGYAFERASDLQAFVEKVIAADLPVWSFMFVNPRMAGMRNRAADLSGYGNVKKAVRLPEAYLAILTFRAQDAGAVEGGLEEAAPAGAARLSPQITAHEWEDRFKIMLVKRLGPSLVPAEVVVPVSGLAGAMDEMESRVHHPVLKEGIVIRRGSGGRPEVVLLGFIPGDERTLGYNLMFALSLSIMRIAGKYGGRLYGTGMYFASMADDILGRTKADRLRRFTAEVDPVGVMNPGKVTDAGPLSRMLKLAALFEPLARPLGNLVASRVGERPGAERRGIPGDVAWYAYACSQCGYCVDVCDQFYGRGWESQSPRGKWYWLREYLEGLAKWDQRMVDTFMVCTTCEACDTRCGAGLPIETSWMKLRGALIERDGRMTFPPFEMMAEALRAEGDIWAGYRSDRANWFPEDLADRHGPGVKAPAAYFAGCTASYVEHDIAMATARLLDEAGVGFTYLGEEESCCGTPMLVAGKWEVFVEVMKRNIAAVKASGADTVISSCPACDMMWRHTYPEWCRKLGMDYGITARHYSEVVAERLADGTFAFPREAGAEIVTWHDSCHIGRASGVYDEPRALIEAVPGTRLVEMEHNREEALCCGSVLTLIKEPPVAAEIGEVRLAEAEAAGADKVLALCPCCQFQLRVSADKKGYDTEVVDLARYCASALGYEFPDPNPEVAAQWAVFEAMIELMTPRGFADLMGTMWPELIDAMPLGMGRMMRLMGRVPFALSAMKPMFPVLFPRLLPLMMPKVMPVMLARVAERIPMPDYMAEQMPELMPKVMDNLMPHMIGDVVPLVTDPMIEYLKSGA
ncbi:MAG: FAD-binding oxidoreductase [Actinobacteria bacterium]|nr:FAD-binding oxidoreductase [Actinomycetota bacterium]